MFKNRATDHWCPPGKLPEHVIPPEVYFYAYFDTDTTEYLETITVFCCDDNVAKAATKLSGCAGPCGVVILLLREWVLRQGVRSNKLHKELALWVELLSNSTP